MTRSIGASVLAPRQEFGHPFGVEDRLHEDLQLHRALRVEREGRREVALRVGVDQVGRAADAELPQPTETRQLRIADVHAENGLVDPVDEALWRDAGLQQQLDQVAVGECLDVGDTFFCESGAVVDVDALEVGQRFRFIDPRRPQRQLFGDELEHRVGDDAGEEREAEHDCLVAERGDRHERREYDDDEDAGRDLVVGLGPEVAAQVAAQDGIDAEEVRTEEPEGDDATFRFEQPDERPAHEHVAGPAVVDGIEVQESEQPAEGDDERRHHDR